MSINKEEIKKIIIKYILMFILPLLLIFTAIVLLNIMNGYEISSNNMAIHILIYGLIIVPAIPLIILIILYNLDSITKIINKNK